VAPEGVSDTELSVAMDPARLPWLRAGGLEVAVVHSLPEGGGALPGPSSDVLPVVLHPRIERLEAIGSGPEARLQIELSPWAGRAQPAAVVLNRWGGTAEQSYVLLSERRDRDDRVLSFSLKSVAPGEYLVQVQISGASSLLEVDEDPKSPDFQRYVGPRVRLA